MSAQHAALLMVGGAPAGATDPNFASVQLLLHGDGANNGAVFTDSSSFARTPTVTGGIVTAADASAFGGSSIRCFSGAVPNFLNYAGSFAGDHEAITVECWARIVDFVGTAGAISGDRGEFFQVGAANQGFSAHGFVVNASTHSFQIPGAFSIPWATYGLAAGTDRVFLMYCRDTVDNGSLYFNGFYVASTTFASSPISSINIGNRATTGRTTGAFIEEFRFTKGVQRQLRGSLSIGNFAFTPPTAPFPNS